ncbi:ABC transporter ATP-binding protein [Brevibacillus laterosporus]|uniref:ABC transporter ATP-binding protein n=1 Tax=Brevibacillus laterosporus TaxID=1465 RepID=A0A502IJ87_BRELA|nr:ABC transporter ATP-binding protein [Brevibacillus laterosporus]QDX93049.1 ABC transporter ATP-binding protein [Brevibacillus laterosporus]TPG85666.1 ABC transporter ATP-binding protein [Brevibacillus laterosporus]
MEALISLEKVSYAYEHKTNSLALKEISLRIPAGKKSVLLGHNGSGKSTLFLQANGIYRPTVGELYYKGEPYRYDRRFLQELRSKVGLVMQDPEHQLLAATVAEDLSYGLCNQGLAVDKVRERVLATAEAFQITEWLHLPLHQLSLGQKKLVTLAGVVVLQPELLLLDEPTAYLDSYHTQLFLTQLEQIHQQGTTVVMSTHDLELAYAWADWVFVMHRGSLLLEGTPREVFQQKDMLRQVQLGIPLLYTVWEGMQPFLNEEQRATWKAPRTVEEWCSYAERMSMREKEQLLVTKR